MFSSRRSTRRSPEWFEAMPTEFQIGFVVLIGGLLIAGKASQALPFLEQADKELINAGATISAILTGAFIYWTFGRRALEMRKAKGRLATLSPENDLLIGTSGQPHRAASNRLGVVAHMAQISNRDSTFSTPVLHDFCRTLFRRAAIAKTPEDWMRLRPHIAPPAQTVLRGLLKEGALAEVHVGRVHINRVEEQRSGVAMHISVHALTRDDAGNLRFLDMNWDLRRGQNATSMTPMDVDQLGCPACGSPVELSFPDGTCAVCESRIAYGDLGWQIFDLGWRGDRPLVPDRLGPLEGGVDATLEPETPVDPHLAANLRALKMRHESFDLSEAESRFKETLLALQLAFDTGDMTPIEPLVTPGIRDTVALQVARAGAGELTWRRRDVKVDGIEAVRVFRDAWHEMFDVRIRFQMISAIVDAQDICVAGSLSEPKHLSVYLCFHQRITPEPFALTRWKLWRVVSPGAFLR